MTFTTRLRPLVLALAFTLPLAGCGQKSPESRIESAKQAIQKLDNKTAIIELKTVLQSEPGNAEARLLLGQSFQNVGQWEDSEKELRKAIEFDVLAERVLPLLAKTLVKVGKYKEAIDLAVPKVGMSSQALASIQAEKANAFLGLNNATGAAAAVIEGENMLTAVGGNTFSKDLQLAKARLAFSNKQPAQALALLDAALQRDAKFTEALYFKAQLLEGEGKAAEALKVYEQITAATPGEILAHLAIVDLKLRRKDVAAAEKALQAAEKIDTKMLQVKYLRGRLFLIKGDMKQANEAVQQVLRDAPDHLPSLLLDAMVSYGLGNYEQSLKSANKVLVQLPGHLNATKLVATNELRRGNPKAALDSLQPLVQAHPEDIELLSLLGEANLQAKQYDKAMAFLDRAASLQPKNAAIKHSQARGHLAQGRTDQALLNLELASSLSEQAGQADISLVMLHLSRKDYSKAQQAIANLERKLPNNPVISNMSGLAYLGKDDRLSARKAFERSLAIQPDFFAAAANLARLDLADNKTDAARQRFEAVLKKDDKNVQAMMALAEMASANKQEKIFLGWLEKATKADPKVIAPRAVLVRHYLAKKDSQKALTIAREAVTADPDSPDAYSLLGSAQMATGDESGSVSSFLRVTEKLPNSAEAFYRLGAAQIASDRVKDGRVSFEKALTLQPDHAGALDSLLLLDTADKKPDLALQRARAFQAQNPRSPAGFVREADILFGQGQYAKAARIYEQAYSQASDLNIFAKLLNALGRSGEQKMADKKLSDLLARSPNDIKVQSFAAVYMMGLGRNAESLRLFESLQKVYPQNPAILNNLALVYQRLNDARALQMAEQANKLAPQNPEIMDTLGWILVQNGQAERALEFLRKASDAAPREASVRYHLAAALAKTGRNADAKRELDALLKAGTRFPELEEAKKLLNGL